MQFASCQHRFQHVSGIHRAVGLSGADDQVQLIDEQNDFSVALSDFLQNGFQTLLEFATVFCTGYQGSHIEGENGFIFQALRYIAVGDSLGQAFYDCGFTNTRLTDQNRIVFCLTGQDTDNVPNFGITADNRVHFLVSGFFYDILSIFFQGVVCCLRVVGGNSLVSAHGA